MGRTRQEDKLLHAKKSTGTNTFKAAGVLVVVEWGGVWGEGVGGGGAGGLGEATIHLCVTSLLNSRENTRILLTETQVSLDRLTD